MTRSCQEKCQNRNWVRGPHFPLLMSEGSVLTRTGGTASQCSAVPMYWPDRPDRPMRLTQTNRRTDERLTQTKDWHRRQTDTDERLTQTNDWHRRTTEVDRSIDESADRSIKRSIDPSIHRWKIGRSFDQTVNRSIHRSIGRWIDHDTLPQHRRKPMFYVSMYVCMHLCSENGGATRVYIYIYIHIYTHIYIYIYACAFLCILYI